MLVFNSFKQIIIREKGIVLSILAGTSWWWELGVAGQTAFVEYLITAAAAAADGMKTM